LQNPSHYHVHILPEDYRKETIAELNQFIEEHNKKYNTNISHHFTHILHELEQPTDNNAIRRFFEITKQVDSIRNENIFETIPELKAVKLNGN
jgi:hypothetical protein